MKSLLIVAVAALASLWPSGNVGSFITLRATITVKATHQPVHSGSIVMEDAVILITDTGDPKEDIVNIKVFTQSETPASAGRARSANQRATQSAPGSAFSSIRCRTSSRTGPS